MKHPYLEITYRKGRPLAAYLYLSMPSEGSVGTTERFEDGILIDYAENGHPVGVEFLSPQVVTRDVLDRLLDAVGMDRAVVRELSPLVSW